MGKTEKKQKENHTTKVTTIPKTKRQKYGMNETIPISKLLLNLLGFKSVVQNSLCQSMNDPSESQGFFDCAIDNLRASPFLIQYIQEFVSLNHFFDTIFFLH